MSSKPRIVVLDSEKFNDLSWDAFRSLGELVLHERTKEPAVAERAAGASIILTNKTPLSAPTLAALPSLKYIGVLATGHNVVDSATARTRGIPVTNVPEYGTLAVAQHTFALLLELTQHVGRHAASVRDGAWVQGRADWCFWESPVTELAGLRLGLIGAGRIAQAVARIGEAFGMTVAYARRADGPAGLANVLRTSDVISLHCPLTPDTREIIRADTLKLMKPSAFLINTSRGPLINDRDLAHALDSDRIAGAALDVLSVEPPPSDNPLLRARHCLITPHMAWAATPARSRLLGVAASNIQAFLSGHPQNLVN